MRALHWFRNDLRLRDNTALAAAASRADEIALVFVFDRRLLAGSGAGAPRIRFLWDAIERLGADLAGRGHELVLRCGDPEEEIPRLLDETRAGLLSFNRDTAPFARRRDDAVRAAAGKRGARVIDTKDRVLFESGEIRTQSGGPFKVFTPFRNAWLARLEEEGPRTGGPLRLPAPVTGLKSHPAPTLGSLDAADDATEIPTAGEAAARRRLDRFLDGHVERYAEQRDLPAVDGTSRLSPHLRLGTVSPRICVDAALEVVVHSPRQAQGARKWLDELVWREFYAAILEENPHVLQRSYRPEYDALQWEDDDEHWQAFCEGRTGYPFVDAALRQLLQTGWMHNRARMVVASFLTKDLLIDWRRGERFFLQRLVDGDPASNNGGWQWAASTGTDAQPYFRIFNPVSQGERFDPDGAYVRRYVPELADVPDRFVQSPWRAPEPPAGYPAPIVEHARQRKLALTRYEAARGGASAQKSRARR